MLMNLRNLFRKFEILGYTENEIVNSLVDYFDVGYEDIINRW